MVYYISKTNKKVKIILVVYSIFNSTFNIPDLTNKFIEGNGTGYIKAGLPNITGKTTIYSGFDNGGKPDGCFYVISSRGTGGMIDGGDPKQWIGFNASRSSSIYGNSNTVQPESCKCNFYIKY